MSDFPFWSDDFDLDFPKLFPEAKAQLGALAAVVLYTPGHTTHGRLNHPSVWNDDHTMLAFFGFRGPDVPSPYYFGSDKIVRCTAWEAFRDAWPHHYQITLMRQPVWDTFALDGAFETIMWHVRGWRRDEGAFRQAKAQVAASYLQGITRLRRIVDAAAPGIVEYDSMSCAELPTNCPGAGTVHAN